MHESANFNFLKVHPPVFLQLASAAERAFSSDPNTTLIKLRQFAEAMAQDLASRSGVSFEESTSQSDLQSLTQLDQSILSKAFKAELVPQNQTTNPPLNSSPAIAPPEKLI